MVCVRVVALMAVLAALLGAAAPTGGERQITFSPQNHDLDNNEDFSADGRFLCYDTRGTVGPGIESCQSIGKVEIATGKETVLYAPHPTVVGTHAAPGVGAASFSPVENKVAFIHGPFLQDVVYRGWYAFSNRQGAEVVADGSGRLDWLDARDVATNRDTIPGALRGGTHRHEYTLDGRRIGFTYNDFLMPQYGRTVGYMVKSPKAPSPATHYCAILVPVVPRDTAKPGQLVMAQGDSWVGRHGYMRAFIGTVREANGSFMDSLFVVDVPANVDITTADSGSATRFPSPPKGTRIRRLTHTPASGTVRGTIQGDRIAYFAPAPDGTNQIFIIPSDGSDRSPDPAKRPVQLTHLPKGASGLRWHPSGNSIICVSNGGIVAVCAKPGPQFGHAVFLTAQGPKEGCSDPDISPDGKLIAYTRVVPTKGKDGRIVKTYDGKDLSQIFTVPFPDANGDGIAD